MRDRRDEVFDALVERALASKEMRGRLPRGAALTEDLIRSRCAARRDEMWSGVGDVAGLFDTVARRKALLDRAGAVLKALWWLFTSVRTQVSVVVIGVLLIIWAFVGVPVDRSDVQPVGYLLAAAIMLLAAGGVGEVVLRLVTDRLPRRLRLQKVLVMIDPVALVALGAAMFYPAVLSVFSQEEMKKDGLGDHAGSLVPFVLSVGLLFAAPFLLRILRRRPGSPKGLRPFGALLVVVIGAPVLLAFVDAIDAVAVRIAPFDDLGVFIGMVVVALGGALAVLGSWAPTMPEVRRSHAEVLSRVSRELTEAQILPFLRQEITRHADDYGVRINVRERPGLSQVFDPLYRVPIAAAERVATLLEGMSGGSIGLAGARGSGKTTLIESYCGGGRHGDGLATAVAAPVEYSAREFLLHLYAKVCREVLGQHHDLVRHHERLARIRLIRRKFLLLIGAVVVSAAGWALLALPSLTAAPATQLWGAVLVLAGGTTFLAVVLSWLTSIRDPGGFVPSLEAHAADRLEEIRFQQSFTATATGTVKLPIGIEGALSRARGLTRQPMTLPEIVESLRDFLTRAAEDRGRVVIGIDELDKMRSESAAEQFLNEIKGVFGIPGCYFLVSVSEEAMSTFERRGLPFRDVFDSTFDEIVWFEHLTVAEAMATIDRRVLIPVPFKQLCYVLSGGLPRELIRATRGVIQAQDAIQAEDDDQPIDLSRIASRLVTEDVRRKTRAVTVAARRLDAEPHLSTFLLVSDEIRALDIDADTLYQLIQKIIPASGEGAGNPQFRTLVGELACFYYYSATVLDFFDSEAYGGRWRIAGTAAGSQGLGDLVKARQSFSTSTLVAWHGISRFRNAWSQPILTLPDGLLPHGSH